MLKFYSLVGFGLTFNLGNKTHEKQIYATQQDDDRIQGALCFSVNTVLQGVLGSGVFKLKSRMGSTVVKYLLTTML